MITQVDFVKMVASGNDFVVAQLPSYPLSQLRLAAQKICNRKYGVGGDGFLVLEKSVKADIRMRIFNPDGTEAEMCGNGARCAALFISTERKVHDLNLETKAGIIESQVESDNIRIKLTDPKDIKLDIPVKVNDRSIMVNFINTGVPHAVIFVDGIDNIDIVPLGRQVRRHKQFAPAGTNVNFVEIWDEKKIQLRTYERGVEDETLACGTGTVASGIISALKMDLKETDHCINALTRSGETLKVYFDKKGNDFSNIWLAGKARSVFKSTIAL